MSDPFQWPALANGERHLGETLECQVGVWGKVHRQASDFRWIARGDGFGEGHKDLSRNLRIGSEDQSIELTAWRALVDKTRDPGSRDYFAIGAYPSRAVDALGRQAGLEKAILHWRRFANGPPATLAAFALLSWVVEADDRLWWDRIDQGDWQQPDYALPLDARACPSAAPIDGAALVQQIEQGIGSLADALDIERLARLYALLLGGAHPIMLHAQVRPLPPSALAALLLPLPAQLAETISLTAWVPSMLVDAADVGKNWDLAVTARPGMAPSVDPAELARGTKLAEALLERAPERLASATPLAAGSPAEGPEPAQAADRIDRDDQGSSARRSLSGGLSLHPNPRLGLATPPSGLPPALTYLHEFADCIHLRRLDLRRLRVELNGKAQFLPAGEDPARHPLVAWIRSLQADIPTGVHPREWQFKIDQLRSAALVLLPSAQTLAIVGLPEAKQARVPALLVALAFDPEQAGRGLAEHGRDVLQQMLQQSLDCHNPLVERIRDWMVRWSSLQQDAALHRGLDDLLSARRPRS